MFSRSAALSVWLIAGCAALGVDAGYKQILVTARAGQVEVRLPLTDVSGAARVKQRADDGFGVPIAPTRTNLDGSCYLEWQISYDTMAADHPSIVPEVTFQRGNRTKHGCELTKILVGALEQGVVTRDELKSLRGELDQLKPIDLESAEKVALQPEPQVARDAVLPAGFERFVQRVPQFVRSTPQGSVEIQFKPKQRAVGYQPMVYVCLPSVLWRQENGELRGPGHAKSKETVIYRFGAAERDFLLSIVRAFGAASHEHNEDLSKILDAILAK
jgi:hypothetical protein